MEKLLLLAIFWLITAPHSHTIKIGISHSYNTTVTATPPTTTTVEPGTTTITTAVSSTTEPGSSMSPLPELATSTPSQTFPPRPQAKPQATDAPETEATPATATTTAPTTAPATAPAEAQPLNATETPKIPMNFPDDSFYFCSCDLRSEMCDLNCCCDRDCPTETRQVFSCLKVLAPPQLVSRLEDFQYTHGLPSCQINDGWLCVFRSNTKPPKMKPLVRNFDASKYQKWPDPLGAYETEDMGPPPATSSLYKLGEPLQLWHPESKQWTTFELPTGYEGAQCHLKQLIRHLQPMASDCLMRDQMQLQESVWALLNLTASHQLLPKPRDLEEQQVEAVDIQICQQLDNGRVHCPEPGNDTQWEVPVESLELQLIHNFTNILEAKLLIKEATATEEEEDSEPIWLHYAVTFATANESRVKPSSGPLGYLAGAPVILSRMLPQNTSEDQQLLSYFHARNDDPDYHWLPLFSRQPRNGNCQRKLDEKEVLRFGVDLAKQCLLHQAAPPAPLQQNANHTQFCQRLQAEIWKKLLPHNCSSLEELSQVFVSQLGRPQPDRWIPIQLHFEENSHDVPPPVQGFYDEVQQSLSCRNMFLSVGYEFHVAELALLEGRVPHQSVLQHARVVLGQRHDLTFDGSEQQLVELPLGVSAMFYNLEKSRPNGAAAVISSRIVLAMMPLLCLWR